MYKFRTFMVPASLTAKAEAITNALGGGHKGMFIVPVDDVAMISTGAIESDSPLLGTAADLWAAVQASEEPGIVTLADCEALVAALDLTDSEPHGRMGFIRDEVADTATAPAWVQPTGAHNAYAMDAAVTHAGKGWRSLTPANVWAPGVSGWRELWGQGGATEWPEWIRPTGAHDAYKIGDKVTFAVKRYVSKLNANTWSPTEYPAGWALQP